MLHRLTAVVLSVLLSSGAWAQVGHFARFLFNGDSAGDNFGRAISGAGDVNRDGFADLVVGADGDSNNGPGSGSARVFSGLDGSILYTFNGDSEFDRFGSSVSGAGDVNNDGFDDIIVGATFDSVNAGGLLVGSVRVFSGSDGAVLHTFFGESAGSGFGSSVSGVGDLNNDGFDDVIVGVPLINVQTGRAIVFSGLDGSILYIFNGATLNEFFGIVSDAGDVNNDGVGDLIVGATRGSSNGNATGSARVFSGSDGSVLYTFYGESDGDQFGSAVGGAGDVNNDGFDDVVVGAPRDDNQGVDSGSATVFSGLDGSILHTFNGYSAEDRFGVSVDGAGDVNGDGFDDIIVGAYQDDNNGAQSGNVRVFSGVDGSVLYTFDGDSPGDAFGFRVSGAGDTNADGFDDFMVGATGDDNNGSGSGSVRVFVSRLCPGDANGDMVVNFTDLDIVLTAFGELAPDLVGDLNGDGVVNFADLNEVLTHFGASCPG